jgi:hypothetical protein
LTTPEVRDLPRSALSRTHRLRGPSNSIVVKGMVEVVVAAIVEGEDNLILQTLTKFISAPSHDLLLNMSVNGTKRMRNFTSSVTRRGPVSSNARS